ncbi:unnamed protein product, partial [Ixodes persulcatus]
MADEADRTDLPMEESIDEGSCSANEALGADDATTEDTLLEDEGPQRSKEPQVVVKFTYSEHADTAARTDEEIEEILGKLKLEGSDVPRPVLKLEETGLPDELVSKLKDIFGSQLGPFASYGLPSLLSGRDHVSLGDASMSERVLSFLPHVVAHCQRNMKGDCKGPIAMVVASSCRQVRDIYKYFRDAGRPFDLECLEISEETSNDRDDFQSGTRRNNSLYWASSLLNSFNLLLLVAENYTLNFGSVTYRNIPSHCPPHFLGEYRFPKKRRVVAHPYKYPKADSAIIHPTRMTWPQTLQSEDVRDKGKTLLFVFSFLPDFPNPKVVVHTCERKTMQITVKKNLVLLTKKFVQTKRQSLEGNTSSNPFRDHEPQSAMSENNGGPSTDSCGSPDITGHGGELNSLAITNCTGLDRKDSIRFKTVGSRLSLLSLYKSNLWQTVSKALENKLIRHRTWIVCTALHRTLHKPLVCGPDGDLCRQALPCRRTNWAVPKARGRAWTTRVRTTTRKTATAARRKRIATTTTTAAAVTETGTGTARGGAPTPGAGRAAAPRTKTTAGRPSVAAVAAAAAVVGA